MKYNIVQISLVVSEIQEAEISKFTIFVNNSDTSLC